jgi:hypothetical protein
MIIGEQDGFAIPFGVSAFGAPSAQRWRNKIFLLSLMVETRALSLDLLRSYTPRIA